MDKFRYTIVAFASPSTQRALEKFRAHFDMALDKSSADQRYILKDTAHIAIKRTFFLKPDRKEEELVKRLGELTVCDSILIRCSEAGVFTNTAYGEVVYVKVDRSSQLEKLHSAIKQKIDDMAETKDLSTEGEKYVPHITLAYDMPKEKVVEAQQYIDAKIIPCDFYIRQIALLRDYNAEKDERAVVSVYDLA